MRSLLWLAVGATLLPAAAIAQTVVIPHRIHPHRLPLLSDFSRPAPGEVGSRWPRREPRLGRAAPLPTVVTGGLWPRITTPTHRFGGAYAVPGYAQTRRWATGGTGVSGLIGNTGNPFAGQARWGTADSATSGPGLAPRGWANGYGRSLVAGEPAVYPTAYAAQSYGAAPQLGFFGTGTPYTMSYYSSGSSAGPYGSPGGLAVYRSGSYGYGPRVIHVPQGYGRAGNPGARIIHLGRRHRPEALD